MRNVNYKVLKYKSYFKIIVYDVYEFIVQHRTIPSNPTFLPLPGLLPLYPFCSYLKPPSPAAFQGMPQDSTPWRSLTSALWSSLLSQQLSTPSSHVARKLKLFFPNFSNFYHPTMPLIPCFFLICSPGL